MNTGNAVTSRRWPRPPMHPDLLLAAVTAVMLVVLLTTTARAGAGIDVTTAGVAYTLYAVALVIDLVGAWLAVIDLRERLPRLRAFHVHTAGALPMIYNTHPTVMQVLGDRDPRIVAEEMRNGLNELIGALAEERAAREATDVRLAALGGVGAKLWRLKLAAALLVAGIIVGGVGNIVGQAA